MAATETAVTSADLKTQIERMTEHDLLEVCQIEELTDLSAWGWDAYHKELQVAPEPIFIVARVIADELHINNMAVRPEHQRMRLGLALLQETIAQAKQRGAIVANLE